MKAPPLYNGPVETALRVLTLIEAFNPDRLNLEEIRLLDHFVVFAGDAGAPINLHPPTRGRANAFTFRKSLLSPALEALVGLEIAAEDRTGPKTSYGLRESEAKSPLAETGSDYLYALRETALWLKEASDREGRGAFFSRLRDRMRVLLQEPLEMPESQAERFSFLRANYESDCRRVEGTREGASVLLEWALETGNSVPGLEYRTLEAVIEAANREIGSVQANLKGLKEVMETAG